jgi:ribosomal protein L11 methyltransferase
MTQPIYPFVAVDVPRERADELGALLFELGAEGIEERDEQTLKKGAGDGHVTLVGSFATPEDANAAIEALAESEPDLAPRLEEVVGDAWRDAWKEHFAPFALTSRLTVVPPWITYERARPDEMILELEPGRAFGTGLHATTALVAEILEARAGAIAGLEILDLGTGSGILALVALRYGAAYALAIDNDADVMDVVRENAARNGMAERLIARAGTLDVVTKAYPVVLANIEARVLRPLADDLARVLLPGGLLVLSGILASEHDEMVGLYTSLTRPLKHVDPRRRGAGTGDDWVAIAFVLS